MASKINLTPCGFGCCPCKGGGSVDICGNLVLYCAFFCVLYSFAVISLGTRELFDFLCQVTVADQTTDIHRLKCSSVVKVAPKTCH